MKEISLSRNHSENMLKAMNAPLKISDDYLSLEISPLNQALKAQDILIPNDPSSAFYFALAAIILPNSKVVLKIFYSILHVLRLTKFCKKWVQNLK